MPTIERPEEDAEPEQVLPEGTETVIWAATAGDFHLGNPSDYPEDCFPEELDLSPVPARVEGTTDPTIAFEAGEEMPLPVAEDQWSDWHDRMIALDSDGNRVDSTGGSSLDLAALEKWRVRNE
ncbi:hypothetical protein ACAH01_14755 [Halomicrobium sp. HM KBTZ05]|uniref:hypothetical protein n=1 Tax=Halomicrobium sp. HM KBTZ05 TaxID=3242663 RepID=UPI0035580A49